MQTSYVLFICRANVWRSQIAEWLYRKYYHDRVMSIAGAEAKKEKYHGRPLPAIIDFLDKNWSIDISSQSISYLSDIPLHTLRSIRSVCFLYDPRIEADCDISCTLDGISPYDYFQKQGVDIIITPIEDPFDGWVSRYDHISREIDILITSLSGFTSFSKEWNSK